MCLFTTLMLQRGESDGWGLGLSHPSPIESWEDEGGLAALRLLHHEPWVRKEEEDEVDEGQKRWRQLEGEGRTKCKGEEKMQ